MKISVVIPVYNAEQFIERTVTAVLEQNSQGFDLELVTVNDGSSDRTLEILNNFKHKIKIVDQVNRGPAAARNAGANAASGDILVFTDSDTIAQPGWLQSLYQGFSEEGVEACAGSYCIANGNSPLARVIQSEIEFRYGSFPEFIKFAGTYNLAVTKALFTRIGGFDETYRQASGEDNDFCYKIVKSGKLIKFIEPAKVAHFHTESLPRYLKEQYRHGYWRSKLYFTHPERMGGDDYTYWKDIVEPPACLASALGLLLLIFSNRRNSISAKILPILPLLLLFFLELWQSRQFNLGTGDKFFAAKVIFLRAFARTAGFLHGVISSAGRLKCKKKSA